MNLEAFIETALIAFVDEQRAANDRIRQTGLLQPPIGSMDPKVVRHRRLFDRDGSMRPKLSASARDDFLSTPFGNVMLRIHGGQDYRQTVVHFHGGGWAFGSIYEQDWLLERLADQTSATVISVDYPLAPENQLPHAIAVATATLMQIIASRAEGAVAVVGESAGAHIALSSVLGTPLHLRSRIAAMSLAYGIFDLSMTPSQVAWGEEFLGLSTPWLRYFYELTLPGLSPAERADARHSPLNADLRHLPPVLLSVGELDPLLDDTLLLFERWRAAGNDASLSIYPEAPHGFNHLGTRIADACNDRILGFLATEFERQAAAEQGRRTVSDDDSGY